MGTGYSEVNVNSGDDRGGLLNAFDTGTLQFYSNGATPLQLDNNGLPSASLTSTQEIIYPLQFNDNQFAPGIPWVFKWTPAGAAVLRLDGLPINTPTLITGCTVTAGPTITMTAGVAARVEFTPSAVASSAGTLINARFQAAAYAPTSNKPVLCRVSDEAAITAGQYFTPEYISVLQGLNLKTIRMMPWMLNPGEGNSDNLAAWGNRGTTSMIGWGASKFFPGIWAGNTSGTDFYTVSPGASTPLTDWTDGETVQANLVNASTLLYTISNAVSNGGLIRLTVNSTTGLSTNQKIYISDINGTLEALGVQTITVINGTTIDLQGTTFTNAYTSGGRIGVQTLTVTGKTNATKLVAYYNGTAGQTLTAGFGTFVYNANYGILLFRPGDSGNSIMSGITCGHPIEAMIDLCNRVNANLWYSTPMMANDGFITSLTTLIRDTLSTSLYFYLEYSNETWNGGAPQEQYAARQGNYLQVGFYWGYTGLRAAMIWQLAKPVWTASGRSASTLRRSLMWQAYGDANTKTLNLEGQLLNPSGNARLTAYLGGGSPPNYSSTGLRPVDLADTVGYALYSSGAIVKNFGYGYAPSVTASVVSRLQTLATAFNSNANDATSLATVDDDFRQGVYTITAIQSISGSSINSTSNGTLVNQEVVFYTTGTLPTPLVTGKIYFVVSPATNVFSVASTLGGSAISLSGGSGTHSFGIVDIPTDGNITPQTLLQFSTSIMRNPVNASYSPGWEGVVASYDAYRTGAGLPLLRVELYEGGLEAKMPTTAECTSMGITVGGSAATASAALVAGLLAYKNSALGKAYALSYYNQFMGFEAACTNTFGLVPHSLTPSWFLLGGPGQWSLLPDQIGSTPLQTYAGVAAFVGIADPSASNIAAFSVILSNRSARTTMIGY